MFSLHNKMLPASLLLPAWLGFLTSLGILLSAAASAQSVGTAPRQELQQDWARQFDQAMQEFIAQRKIPAASLAISFRGHTILEKAYGSSSFENEIRNTQIGDPFRIASITKPMTAALIRKLAAQGKLDLADRVFELLELETADPRCRLITIEHLLAHQSGWDNAELGFDPMFHSRAICRELEIEGPASPEDIIRFMIRRPLNFKPGEHVAYSNFGYCLLGRIAEKATGQSYRDAMRDEIFRPLKMDSANVGRTLWVHRLPGEPRYIHPGSTKNIVDPTDARPVPWPYGGFCLESMDSHGGLVCSAPDVVRFLEAYWINGQPRTQAAADYTFFGSLPGSYGMARQHSKGFNIVALFNQRNDSSQLEYSEIRPLMDTVIENLEWE